MIKKLYRIFHFIIILCFFALPVSAHVKPDDISLNDYSGDIDSMCKVTGFSCEISDYTYSEEQTAELYFAGEKTYDQEGDHYSNAVSISWKLYDEDGYVVDSGTARSSGIKVGEKFKNAKDYVFDLLPGTYYLELLDTD